MKGSLRDQLLRAGLVDETRAKQAEAEKRRESKRARKDRKSGRSPDPTAAQRAAEAAKRERERQAQRSREMNRAREEERARKALRAQIKELLERQAEPRGEGDVRYHFADGKKVKWLYVTRDQQTALAEGRLGIVRWEGRYFVAATEVADQVRERMPKAFVFVAEPEEPDPDDPYADFPIPDDLDW